jgi:hypothetical protein
MKTNKSLIYLLLIIFCSCEKEQEFYSMSLLKSESYVQDKSHGGAYSTPSLILTFKFQNNTNNYTFFSAKQSNEDNRNLSRLYLLDTLKNQIVEVYSGDRPVIKPRTMVEIEGTIEIKDFKSYFDLNENLQIKNDFSKDENIIKLKADELLNNSIILYVQDSSDIKPFLAINRDKLPIKAIEGNIAIKIKKEFIRTKSYSPKKLKKLKEISSKIQ